MSSMGLGRLLIGPPITWNEQMGDPLTNSGGAVVAAQRTPPQYQGALPTISADGWNDTVADRLRIRRQARAILNNQPLMTAAYLYITYSDDPEQNGWYALDQMTLQDIATSAGLATGFWQIQGGNIYPLGKIRTHREARQVWMKDLRTGLFARDYLGWLTGSLDFSALPALQLSVLPNGATQLTDTVSGQVLAGVPLPQTRDNGIPQQVSGLLDLEVIAYERPEAALNLSDVIVYDRRGNTAGPFYASTVLEDNPTSYWRLDETTGTVAADQQGNNPLTYTGGFTLNQTGALVGGGDNDAAVLLNGSTGLVGTSTAASLIPTTTITIEAWAKCATLAGTIAGRFAGASGYKLAQAASGRASFTINGTSVSAPVSMAVTANTWHHYVGTWDGVVMTLYVDGQFALSTPFAGPILLPGGGFQIGANNSANFLSGDIDEVSVYPYALTAAQVANHYASGVSYDGGNQWEEVYGPDYPWSWLEEGGSVDTPVMSNGLCRVRYDPGNTPGLRVDVWQPAGTTNGTAGWVEQGKMIALRVGDQGTDVDNTFVSATLVEWTPERAVMLVVLSPSADTVGRERIFVTLERGVPGFTFECYPALKAAGTQADACLQWTPALNNGAGDLNNSIAKIDSQGATPLPLWTPGAAGAAAYAATAGTGSGTGNSGEFQSGFNTLGAASFATSENWVALLRFPTSYNVIGAYQTTFVTLQAANCRFFYQGSSSLAYGVAQNSYRMQSQNAAGYLQTQVLFSATVVQQVVEGEAMNPSGNWSTVTDATASGGQAVKTTQTSDVTSLNIATWPSTFQATYRVFIRAQATVNSTVYARSGALATPVGDPVTITGQATPTYAWYDLGEVVAAGGTLAIHGWCNTAGRLQIDRMEAVLVQDRTRTGAIFSGSRDQGQGALEDSRMTGALVAR